MINPLKCLLGVLGSLLILFHLFIFLYKIAPAGYREIVRVLLHDFRKIRVDHKNKAGFTALMKAALQGRTSCAKQLLYAGKQPSDLLYEDKTRKEKFVRLALYDLNEVCPVIKINL